MINAKAEEDMMFNIMNSFSDSINKEYIEGVYGLMKVHEDLKSRKNIKEVIMDGFLSMQTAFMNVWNESFYMHKRINGFFISGVTVFGSKFKHSNLENLNNTMFDEIVENSIFKIEVFDEEYPMSKDKLKKMVKDLEISDIGQYYLIINKWESLEGKSSLEESKYRCIVMNMEEALIEELTFGKIDSEKSDM